MKHYFAVFLIALGISMISLLEGNLHAVPVPYKLTASNEYSQLAVSGREYPNEFIVAMTQREDRTLPLLLYRYENELTLEAGSLFDKSIPRMLIHRHIWDSAFRLTLQPENSLRLSQLFVPYTSHSSIEISNLSLDLLYEDYSSISSDNSDQLKKSTTAALSYKQRLRLLFDTEMTLAGTVYLSSMDTQDETGINGYGTLIGAMLPFELIGTQNSIRLSQFSFVTSNGSQASPVLAENGHVDVMNPFFKDLAKLRYQGEISTLIAYHRLDASMNALKTFVEFYFIEKTESTLLSIGANYSLDQSNRLSLFTRFDQYKEDANVYFGITFQEVFN